MSLYRPELYSQCSNGLLCINHRDIVLNKVLMLQLAVYSQQTNPEYLKWVSL